MNKIKIIRCKMYIKKILSPILNFLNSYRHRIIIFFYYYYFDSRINYIVNCKVNYYVIRKEM